MQGTKDAMERRNARRARPTAPLLMVLPASPLALNLALDSATGYVCVILLAAALCYLALLVARTRALAHLASGLAALGALGIAAGLLARWLAGATGFPAQQDMVALFSGLAVLGYLAMEHSYRTRDAGAVTLALVGSALLLAVQATDTAPGARLPAGPALLALYLNAASLAGLIAYGALAMAALPALLQLCSRCGRIWHRLPAKERLRRLTDDWLVTALTTAMLALLIALLLSQWAPPSPSPPLPAPRPWLAATPWAPALAYLYGALRADWRDATLARLALAAGTLSAASVAFLLHA